MGLGGSNPSPGANQKGRVTREREDGIGMKISGIFGILLLLLALASSLPLSIGAAPTLQASGDPSVPPLYTARDKQVVLAGSGYAPNETYYVWMKGPNDNSTHYYGTSFMSLPTGLIPPGVALPISPNATSGTYLLSVSNSTKADTSSATAHFGIWGTAKPVYQRTESVKIMGGGLFPGVSLKLSIRDPAGNYVETATVASNVAGDFNYTWRVPQNAVAETYNIIIDGTGTFDNAQQDYVSESKFTVTPAVLTVQVAQQPNPSYERTETARFSMSMTYPDGSPVLESKQGIRPVTLLLNQSTVGSANVSLIDSSNGIWAADAKILANATPSSRYRFDLPALSFDDSFGNKGGAADIFSGYFRVQNASLVITSEVNGTQIQVPFGQVSVISKIAYPDGTPVLNGTVTVFLSNSSSASKIQLMYDPTLGAWRGSYSSSFWDLWRVGKWTLKVQAADLFGNSGASTFEVVAQPYLFLVIIGVIVAVALVGRWTVSRYGRKMYLRIRKVVQKLRSLPTERFRP
jgi:hypothetical protein